jgi:hypothetical protein
MTTDIAVRGVVENGANGTIGNGEYNNENEEYDDNSSSRLFERHRIKALAGQFLFDFMGFSFKGPFFLANSIHPENLH